MNILVLPGDDIGPAITAAALAIVERVNAIYSLNLSFETRDVGMPSYRRTGTTLPESIVEEALKADGVILGPCGMTEYPPRAKKAAPTCPARSASGSTCTRTFVRRGAAPEFRRRFGTWTALSCTVGSE